jgi:hypothetical protein
MMRRLKESPFLVTVLALVSVLLALFGYGSLALSSPESWSELSAVVSGITKPLSDGQRDQVGTGLSAGGFVLLVVGVILVYRAARGRKQAVELEAGLSELEGLGIDAQQEEGLRLLLEKRFGLKELKEARPWRLVLGLAMVLITVGVAMVLLAPREIEKDPVAPDDPRIALGDNEAVGGQGGQQSGNGAGGGRGSASGDSSEDRGEVLGVETGPSPSSGGKGSSGPNCVCSSPETQPGGGSGGGGGGSSEIEIEEEPEIEIEEEPDPEIAEVEREMDEMDREMDREMEEMDREMEEEFGP